MSTSSAPTFGPDDIDIQSVETVYKGYFRIDRYFLRHRRFGGGWTEVFSRELFERGHAAALLPYDPALDRVALIEQFRIGAHSAGHAAWQLEIVAGIIEDGETPENVAVRETREEAGCAVEDMVRIGDILMTPGGSSESIQIYCGRVDCSDLGGFHGLEGENEDIRAFTIAAEDAFALVRDGRIANAAAVIALQWLQLNRDSLRQRWLGAA